MALFGKKTEEKKDEKKEVQTSDAPVSNEDTALSLPLNLVQPRISEKAAALARLNKYVFIVKKKTNKVEVKKAVEAKYKVKVLQVNILNTKGKFKNFGRTTGKQSDFKKAVVTLKEGDSIKGLTDIA